MTEGGADLGITKTGPASVVAGTGFSYTLDVTNEGDSANTGGYSITDELPDGLSFAGSEDACSSVVDEGIETVTCEDADGIAVDDTETFVFDVVSDPSLVVGEDALSNTASVSATSSESDPDDNADNDTSTATSNVTAEADLSATKDGNPNPVISGNDVTYAVEVSNAGPSAAQDVVLEDDLPAALSNGRICEVASEGDCEDEGDFVAFDGSEDLGTMTAGEERSFRIRATVDPAQPDGEDSLENTATVSSSTDDPVANNDGVDFTSTITEADLIPTLTVAPGPESGAYVAGAAGGLDYALEVDNLGPSNNTGGYDASFTLPSGFSFQTAGTDADCGAVGQVVTCSNTTGLAAAAPADSYTVHVKIASSVLDGTFGATATVGSSGTVDPNSANDTSASADVDVITRADLVLDTNSAATPSGLPASTVYANANAAQNTVTWTIVTRNDGPSDAQAAELAVTLPSQFVNATYCVGPTCTPTTSLSGSISLGTITAGTSKTVKVAAKADATLRNGPITGLTASATASSSTVDPGPGVNTKVSNAVQIFTVADPPSTVTALAGNGNAVVYWPPVANADSGGTAATGYRLTVVALDGGAVPTAPTPACSPPVTGTYCVPPTSVNTVDQGPVVQFQVGNSGSTTLTNGKLYEFRVVSVNAVGFGTDPSDGTTSNQITPSTDASAEILSGADSQATGGGNVANNDPVVAKQSGTFPTAAIGTLEEITGSTTSFRASYLSAVAASPSTFCGNAPCAANTIILNKLTNPSVGSDGRYTIEILYGKQVTFGTGQKRVYFDKTPDSPGDAVQIFECPKPTSKKGPPGPVPLPDACIVKLTTNTQQKNPAVRVLISVDGDIIDPLSGTRK